MTEKDVLRIYKTKILSPNMPMPQTRVKDYPSFKLYIITLIHDLLEKHAWNIVGMKSVQDVLDKIAEIYEEEKEQEQIEKEQEMNSLNFDEMTLNHVFEQNRFGQRISRTLSDFLSRTQGIEIYVRLNNSGKKEYYWRRHADLPLSDDINLKHFAKDMTGEPCST